MRGNSDGITLERGMVMEPSVAWRAPPSIGNAEVKTSRRLWPVVESDLEWTGHLLMLLLSPMTVVAHWGGRS